MKKWPVENWKILLFGLLFLPLMISLGFWQLDRAEEKGRALDRYNQQLAKDPAGWQELTSNPHRYQPFQLTGEYLSNFTLLLDNQIYRRQFGYRVFTPFCTTTTSTFCILVDRGWIKGDLNRSILPSISQPVGTTTIFGKADQLTNNPMTGENEAFTTSPFRVQQIELDSINLNQATALEPKQLVSSVLRLDESAPGHYEITWKPVVMGPEKHYGYAVQWFSMALALVILLIFLALKHRQP